jgi:hypothetical protein
MPFSLTPAAIRQSSAVACDPGLVRAWIRWASIRGWAAVELATIAAVGAAVLVLLITRAATGEWRWLDFAVDLVRNVLIGGLVSAGVVFIDKGRQAERKRSRVLRLQQTASLAASGWNQRPSDPVPDPRDPATIAETIDRYRHSADELREWAEQVEVVHDPPSSDVEAQARALYALTKLGGPIYLYAAEGMRERRFARLEHLANELAGLDDADDLWSGPAAEFRRAVPAAVGWRSHTDATIVERLLVEQQISTQAPFNRQSQAGRDLRARATLDPTASTIEPLYLLLLFVATTSDLTLYEGSDEPRRAVNRCLGALRNELRMVAAGFDAFIPVLELCFPDRDGRGADDASPMCC